MNWLVVSPSSLSNVWKDDPALMKHVDGHSCEGAGALGIR